MFFQHTICFLGSLEDDAFNAIGLLNVDLKIMFSFREGTLPLSLYYAGMHLYVSNCSILDSSIILYVGSRDLDITHFKST